MELSRLASRQKRYRDLTLFASTEAMPRELKQSLEKVLARYREALADCWRRQSVTAEDLASIDSLDRELESLSNAARLRTTAP
jgi:hypothetical protein